MVWNSHTFTILRQLFEVLSVLCQSINEFTLTGATEILTPFWTHTVHGCQEMDEAPENSLAKASSRWHSTKIIRKTCASGRSLPSSGTIWAFKRYFTKSIFIKKAKRLKTFLLKNLFKLSFTTPTNLNHTNTYYKFGDTLPKTHGIAQAPYRDLITSLDDVTCDSCKFKF